MLSLDQAATYLEQAAHVEPPISGPGMLTFNVGINADGQRFTLLIDAEASRAHLVVM